MSSRLGLDRGLVLALAASLACHGAAFSAIALVRFDAAATPVEVELVELAAPAPEPTPAPRVTSAKKASAPEPELAAPALPDLPSRVEPRVTALASAPALPERAFAPPTPRRSSEEPTRVSVARAERTETVVTASPPRPDRPTVERSEALAPQTLAAEATALPATLERRTAAPATSPSTQPTEPHLSLAEPPPGPAPARPPVELGRVERAAAPHLMTLLSSRTPEPEVPAAPAATPTVAPGAPTGVPPAGKLRAALPPAAGQTGAFVAPRLTMARRPRYPETARQAGVEGTVLVKAFVLADGSVREARVERSAGNAALDGAALETIRESRFVPALRGGHPVPVWVEVPIDFRLER